MGILFLFYHFISNISRTYDMCIFNSVDCCTTDHHNFPCTLLLFKISFGGLVNSTPHVPHLILQFNLCLSCIIISSVLV